VHRPARATAIPLKKIAGCSCARASRLSPRFPFGPIGVAGVIGAVIEAPVQVDGASPPASRVVNRDRLLCGPDALLALAESLDELVLVLPKGTPLRLDPALGFHFYDADLCLQARALGLAAVAFDALCFHNQRAVELPPDFEHSGRAFAKKWRAALPVKTTCAGGRPLARGRALTVGAHTSRWWPTGTAVSARGSQT
jgi:hypothetical protein